MATLLVVPNLIKTAAVQAEESGLSDEASEEVSASFSEKLSNFSVRTAYTFENVESFNVPNQVASKVPQVELTDSTAKPEPNQVAIKVPQVELTQSTAKPEPNRVATQVPQVELTDSTAKPEPNRVATQVPQVELTNSTAKPESNRVATQVPQVELTNSTAKPEPNRVATQVPQVELHYSTSKQISTNSRLTAKQLTANSRLAEDLSGTQAQSLPNTQSQPVYFSPANKQVIIPDRGIYFSITPAIVFGYGFDTTSGTVSPSKFKTDTGFSISGALGYKFRDFRVEGEFTYGRNDAKKREFENGASVPLGGYFQTYAYMLNGYYDIPLSRRFRPYIGGGLGAASFSAENVTQTGVAPINGSTTVFAYQFKAGISYQLTDNFNVFMGYRLFGVSGQNYKSGTDKIEGDGFTSNSLQFGARLLF